MNANTHAAETLDRPERVDLFESQAAAPPRRSLGGPSRRASERHAVSAPCKLVASDGARFVGGRLRNVSSTGALIEVPGSSVVPREGVIEALIDWPGSGLVTRASARTARVVRVGRSPDGAQLVGIRFEREATSAVGALASRRIEAKPIRRAA